MICFFESVLLKEGERTLEKLTAFITSGGFVGSLVVIALTALIIMLLKKLKKSYISRDGVDGKRETNARFIFSIARYVVFLIAFITVLQINGVNVSALVTGLGIVGIVVGFALQDVLKDFVMGNNIMLDHFFVVGDVVKYGNVTGKIVSFNIKVTRILDIDTGNFLTVSNRNISEMTVLSNWRDINIPAPYEQSAEHEKNHEGNMRRGRKIRACGKMRVSRHKQFWRKQHRLSHKSSLPRRIFQTNAKRNPRRGSGYIRKRGYFGSLQSA